MRRRRARFQAGRDGPPGPAQHGSLDRSPAGRDERDAAPRRLRAAQYPPRGPLADLLAGGRRSEQRQGLVQMQPPALGIAGKRQALLPAWPQARIQQGSCLVLAQRRPLLAPAHGPEVRLEPGPRLVLAQRFALIAPALRGRGRSAILLAVVVRSVRWCIPSDHRPARARTRAEGRRGQGRSCGPRRARGPWRRRGRAA
jgi:hypothetical protein